MQHSSSNYAISNNTRRVQDVCTALTQFRRSTAFWKHIVIRQSTKLNDITEPYAVLDVDGFRCAVGRWRTEEDGDEVSSYPECAGRTNVGDRAYEVAFAI